MSVVITVFVMLVELRLIIRLSELKSVFHCDYSIAGKISISLHSR